MACFVPMGEDSERQWALLQATARQPEFCAGCDGRDGTHEAGCEVLVVETARRRLSMPEPSRKALDDAENLSVAWGDPWHPDAIFWRDVADEIEFQLNCLEA